MENSMLKQGLLYLLIDNSYRALNLFFSQISVFEAAELNGQSMEEILVNHKSLVYVIA